MAHWAELLSRFIMTILSFINLGTGLRCFIDLEFITKKIFQITIDDNLTLSHLFGIYSLLTSFIFSQSAIYLYVFPLTRLVYASIISYLLLFLIEIKFYKKIVLTSSILFPIIVNVLTLIWLIIFHIWKPYRLDPIDPEKDALLKHGLPYKKQSFNKLNKKKK